MWNEVFAGRYGEAPPPEYTAVKLKVDIDKPNKLQEWLSTTTNPDFANRMVTFIKRNKKKGFANLILPAVLVEEMGIPEELDEIVDLRGNVLNNTGPFYLVASTLGVHLRDNNNTNLISDYFMPTA